MDDRTADMSAATGGAQSTSGDLGRTRAVLRLLFDPQTADDLTSHANYDEAQLIRDSVRRWMIERWTARLTRRTPQPSTPPLSPLNSTSAVGAVALAFQLGFGTSVERIARAAGVPADEIGEGLYAIRQRLSVGEIAACREFTSSVGRYRDTSLDMAERAAMLHHAQRCGACRTALNQFQGIDTRLTEQIEREMLALDVASNLDLKSKSRRHPWRWATGISILLILGTTIGILTMHLQSSSATPGAQSNDGTGLSGWLLSQSDDGQVTALNLATGLRQIVVPAETQSPDLSVGITHMVVSPDGRLIARQEPVAQPQPHTELSIFALDGSMSRSFDLQDNGRFTLSGWLTNDTVLEISQPSQDQNEPLGSYVTGLQTNSTVIAVNIASGVQHEMFRGSVQAIYPSPDRSLVVMSTWSNANGGPSEIELRPILDGKIGDAMSRTEAQFGREPIWAPDSSRVYISPIIDPSATPTAVTDVSTATLESNARQEPTGTWDRAGKMTLLTPLPEGVFSYPIAVSPDGTQLVSVTGSYNTAAGASRFQIWRTTATGDDPVALAGASPNPVALGIWSPNGDILMLQYIRPFLIGPSVDNVVLGTVLSSSTLAVFPDGHSDAVRTQLDAVNASGYLSWLPADALRDAVTGSSGGQPGIVATVDQLSQGRLETESSSQVSLNGQYVTLRDADTDTPVIWDRSAGTGRRLADGSSDLSWLPQGNQVIAAGTLDAGRSTALSRLMTFAPSFGKTVPDYDYRAYDPAGIGTSQDSKYADPSFSPSENTLAFFTVDNQGVTSLWLASFDVSAKLAYRWTVPADSKAHADPIAPGSTTGR